MPTYEQELQKTVRFVIPKYKSLRHVQVYQGSLYVYKLNVHAGVSGRQLNLRTRGPSYGS